MSLLSVFAPCISTAEAPGDKPDPLHAAGLYTLAAVYAERGDSVKAVETLDQSIAMREGIPNCVRRTRWPP